MTTMETEGRRDIDSAARFLLGTCNQATAEQFRTWAAQNFGRTAALYRRCAELTEEAATVTALICRCDPTYGQSCPACDGTAADLAELYPACTGAPDLCGAPAGMPCEPGCPSLAADPMEV